jgi:hypothetical protein
MTNTEPAPYPVTCATCVKGIECCACCDREDCASAVCYRCLVKELGTSVTDPHTHGG